MKPDFMCVLCYLSADTVARHPKHILNKNPISTLRLVDHDVRDGTDKLAVLQNR
jgi:hypothetical protein